MYPYNHKMQQTIQSNVEGISPDRGLISHLLFPLAAQQSVTGILAATALTDEAQEITENIDQPDVPRNVKIKGNAADIAGDVIIAGLNIKDEEITETIALNGTSEVLGNKAFKSITSISLPIETNAGTDTVSVGTSNKLGLPYLLERDTVLKAYRDDALEATHPTVAKSATLIESNTILLNSALNGTDIDVYLIV